MSAFGGKADIAHSVFYEVHALAHTFEFPCAIFSRAKVWALEFSRKFARGIASIQRSELWLRGLTSTRIKGSRIIGAHRVHKIAPLRDVLSVSSVPLQHV